MPTPKRTSVAPKTTWSKALITQAVSVSKNAHAPYSNFHVGAALVGTSGTVYVGCNVENSSYGLCCCAERSAIASAVSAGEKTFTKIVVCTQSSPPSPPCGMCRQVLAEFASELPILLVNPKGEQIQTTLQELLPMSFTKAYL